MKKLLLALSLLLFSVNVSAQQTINANYTFVPNASIGSQIANSGSTGTTVHKIAKLNASAQAVIATTSDTSGLMGIVAFGAGTTGNATIVKVGQATCVFDGATTAGDYVIESVTVNGDCHDGGSSVPSSQSIGRVLSTNGSAGTYNVFVSTGGDSLNVLFENNGTPNSSQTILNCVNSSGAAGITCTNTSGGIWSFSLANTVGGGASTLTVTFTSPAQGDYVCENSSVIPINCIAGVGVNPQTGTTYTVLGGDGGTSDRGKFITVSNTSAVAVTLPQAGTTGFSNGIFFTIKNVGAGAVTITPTTSTIDGVSTLKLLKYQSATIFSDGTNYFSTVRGYSYAVSGSISGAIVGIGCDTGTVTINGAATGMTVLVTPNTYPGAGLTWSGYVSSSNTITVQVCSDVTVTPTASTYNVSLFTVSQ